MDIINDILERKNRHRYSFAELAAINVGIEVKSHDEFIELLNLLHNHRVKSLHELVYRDGSTVVAIKETDFSYGFGATYRTEYAVWYQTKEWYEYRNYKLIRIEDLEIYKE